MRDADDAAALANLDGRMLLIAQVVEGARLHHLTEAEALEQIHGIVEGAGDYFSSFRESGDSLPAAGQLPPEWTPGIRRLFGAESPVLNKSGASVAGVCTAIDCDARPCHASPDGTCCFHAGHDPARAMSAPLVNDHDLAPLSGNKSGGSERDDSQCSAFNADGAPCRRSRVAGASCCEAHGGTLPRPNKSGCQHDGGFIVQVPALGPDGKLTGRYDRTCSDCGEVIEKGAALR